jgi:hypothetical protein
VTLGSVNVNFQVVLKQGHDATAVEMHLLSVLNRALAEEGTVVEFDLLPGTQTKVDPFTPARVLAGPMPLAMR